MQLMFCFRSGFPPHFWNYCHRMGNCDEGVNCTLVQKALPFGAWRSDCRPCRQDSGNVFSGWFRKIKSRLASHETAFVRLRISPSGLERFSATATLPRVWIGYFKSAPGQSIAKIQNRAPHVVSAERIHQNRDPVRLCGQVIRPLFIKDHAVLHPGATAFLHVYAQMFSRVLRLFREQMFDFPRRTLRYGNDRFAQCACIHTLSLNQSNRAPERCQTPLNFFPPVCPTVVSPGPSPTACSNSFSMRAYPPPDNNTTPRPCPILPIPRPATPPPCRLP